MGYKDYVPGEILELYEVHDFKHAAAILLNEFPDEFKEICDALLAFRFTKADVVDADRGRAQRHRRSPRVDGRPVPIGLVGAVHAL